MRADLVRAKQLSGWARDRRGPGRARATRPWPGGPVDRPPARDPTRDLAAALARLCVPGDVLLLVGDLGAGKTTFAQGFGAGLGVAEPVTSPTFTLVRQYPVAGPPPGSAPCSTPTSTASTTCGEIADLGLGELVEDGGVALVEWGDAAEPVLGRRLPALRLEAGGDDDDPRG